MSYTVFALKWRPKVFSDIVGQDHVVNTLKNAIAKNRLAHAYLFAGPRGVGKTSAARILARALNCANGPTAEPCGTCPACSQIAKGSSLDVIEIDGASNRGIDEIRTLRENVKFAPAQGKYKVYIIDEVHQITTDGFNALLKTLEEPPDFVKFIFATTHPHKVPPTILSRCQRLDFRRITTNEIIAQLAKIVAAEGVSVDKDVLVAIARASDGGLRDAESILDQLVAFAKDSVSLDDVVSMLGLVEQSALFNLTERIIARDAKGALEVLNVVCDEGKDLSIVLSNLLEHFRNLMVAKVAKADAQLIDLPQDICERLLQQAQSLPMEEIFNAFNILLAGQDMAKRFDSMRIPIEISLVRLAQRAAVGAASAPAAAAEKHAAVAAVPPPPAKPARPEAVPAPAAMPAQEKSAPSHGVGVHKPVPAARVQAPEPVAGPAVHAHSAHGAHHAVSLDAVKQQWQAIIQLISKSRMSLATFLGEGLPTEVNGHMLTVSFPKNCSLHKDSLEQKSNKDMIEKRFAEVLGVVVRLQFRLTQEERSTATIEDHPVVKSAMDMFNARLIKEN